jgi:threonine dehydrogenase-like Zn-dependent dehydrogenase
LAHGSGFADFMTPKARSVAVLPRSLSLADGAMVEPMACGLRALRQCRARPGERILVLGAGTAALAVIFWARRLGAGRIEVAARSTGRADAVLAFGADAVHGLEDEPPEALRRSLGGAPDIVAECVGKQSLLNLAIDQVRTGGRVLSLGMCAHHEPIIPARCALKEVSLFFPLGYSHSEFVETARAFDAARVNPEALVSEVSPLEALPATIEDLRAGRKAMKIHVEPALDRPHG